MLKIDLPRLYFLVARMANGNEIGFLVSKIVVPTKQAKGLNVMNMVSASENTTLVERPAHGTGIVVSFSDFVGNAFPVRAIVNILAALPQPVIFSAVCLGLVFSLAHHRTAFTVAYLFVMLVYGEMFAAHNAHLVDLWFPVVIVPSGHAFGFSDPLTLFGAIRGMPSTPSFCEEIGNFVRFAARGAQKHCVPFLAFVLSATGGTTKGLSSIYSTRGDFFGGSTVGTKNGYFRHFASPVMQP